ncbi:acetyl-CoA C-acyltransferase family protein [Bosea sp. PAMC 26642]|uniref:acetyl-CoA C-acyltransferase family protein n=1 Tax=Bosea sp. (strain PAMC 26642) TaxID=1792307 RepID=UPI0007704DF6|nr:acetyl-CoA C-acyltransferase family protein [Bosea sp. PAMC 26642]AMJ61493.1 acetyl-CoA acetyltransferase [Bosea sp. PAMC 26642]
MTEVFIVAGQRTAIGAFAGALKDIAPAELASTVVKAAMARSGTAADEVGHVAWGQVIQTEPRDAYIARVAAVNGGIPIETPAFTVNRLCGSGLQAVISAAQTILLGDTDVALCGGSESMSRAPFLSQAMRWGVKMGDTAMVDMLDGALRDPFGRILMGVTAENVAARYAVSREAQDALAVESHRRASHAIREGRFRDQIVGVDIKTRSGPVVFAEDEHVRHDVKEADLAGLRTIFKKEAGSVTAGNASGINDGAAAIVLASAEAVRRSGATPLARLVAYGHAGVDPNYMGIGPVPATRAALARAGLTVRDLDVIESNEAFAAQACAVSRELDFDPAIVNPNGSGISLGHPVGATGAINVVKAVHELRRSGGRYALVTMCIGGGQGISAIFERV